MVMFEPIIPAIIIAIIFAWQSVKNFVSIKVFLARAVFYFGCFLCFDSFFIPLPVNKVGFLALSDPLLPLKEAVRIIPFERMIEFRRHLDYYFAPLYIMWASAFLIGFSLNTAFNKRYSLKKNIFISFIIPFSIFVLYAVIRLITGHMLKRADITDVIWFMMFYFIGYGVNLLICKILSVTKNR